MLQNVEKCRERKRNADMKRYPHDLHAYILKAKKFAFSDKKNCGKSA